MKKKLVLFLLFLTLSSSMVFSQKSKPIGISGTIQASQFGISVPIFLGEKFALVPSFEFKFAETVGMDLGIAIAPRFYLKKDKIAQYLSLRIGTLINKPDSNTENDYDTTVDWLGGLAFGGEYFLSDNFCFGVEIQGNLTKSDKYSNRFGNPEGLNFNTGTMVSATVYF